MFLMLFRWFIDCSCTRAQHTSDVAATTQLLDRNEAKLPGNRAKSHSIKLCNEGQSEFSLPLSAGWFFMTFVKRPPTSHAKPRPTSVEPDPLAVLLAARGLIHCTSYLTEFIIMHIVTPGLPFPTTFYGH